jgi:hypothetical protein
MHSSATIVDSFCRRIQTGTQTWSLFQIKATDDRLRKYDISSEWWIYKIITTEILSERISM